MSSLHSAHYHGGSMVFHDIYEFNLDELTYIMGENEVEVEVYDASNPKKPILICQGKSFMHQLIKKFNKDVIFSIPLLLGNGRDGGEIKVKGVISDVDTAIRKYRILHTAFTTNYLTDYYYFSVCMCRLLEGEAVGISAGEEDVRRPAQRLQSDGEGGRGDAGRCTGGV